MNKKQTEQESVFTEWNNLDLDGIIQFRINKKTQEVEFIGHPSKLKNNLMMKS